VVNLSYGMMARAGYSAAQIRWGAQETSIINFAKGGRAVIAKAAGNDGVAMSARNRAGQIDYLNLSLRGAKSAIFVGALDRNGTTAAKARLASYSNTPGADTTLQKQFLVVGVAGKTTGLHGTSFAAPVVSAYAAVLGSKFTAATPTQIANQLLSTARKDTISGLQREAAWSRRGEPVARAGAGRHQVRRVGAAQLAGLRLRQLLAQVGQLGLQAALVVRPDTQQDLAPGRLRLQLRIGELVAHPGPLRRHRTFHLDQLHRWWLRGHGRGDQVVHHLDQPVVEAAPRKPQLLIGFLEQRVMAAIQAHRLRGVHRFDQAHQRLVAPAVVGVDDFAVAALAQGGKALGCGVDGPDGDGRLLAREVVHRRHRMGHESGRAAGR
jgi:hypothetical protein